MKHSAYIRRLANPLAGLSLLSAAAVAVTLIAIGGKSTGLLSVLAGPAGPSPERVLLLLAGDIALLGALLTLIVLRIRALRAASLPHGARSRLQTQVVRTFSLVTVLPAVAISVFSALLFNFGVEAWFNDRVSTAVNESLAVAEAYLAEHRENVRMAALTIAEDLNRFADLAATDPIEFNRIVSAQASSRDLTEVVVFQHNRIIAQGRLSFSIAFESVPMSAIEQAAGGQVVLLQSNAGEEEKVRALAKIDAMPDTYLLVGRLVDEKVIEHMENTQGAVSAYRELKANLKRLQWIFSIVFVTLALVLLLAVIWYGLVFASRLTLPIALLSAAADRVRAGDYTAKAAVSQDDDELSALSRSFNRMVEQLQSQRGELMEVNRQLDERRRFSEAVLAGVSAGVIALGRDKRIALTNRSSAAILREEADGLKGRTASEVLPGVNELLVQAETGAAAQSTLTIPKDGVTLTLHVRVAIERGMDGGMEGYIVTFDDITPLVSAQRQAAWSDVARRVAHEIKNPLTPIALSAERLKRKYTKYFSGEEAESFTRYVDTIGRHVADIGRMVEEFVSFARMPGAVMKPEALDAILRKVVFSEQVAHPDITYRLESETGVKLWCDERQIAQALSNLLKNAAEALEDRPDAGVKGEIDISLHRDGERLLLEVRDNGPGFPPDQITRLLEPYVTTRSKGTGLGLAIVKKIVEEHKGSVQLDNAAIGARIVLSFPYDCDINAPI